MLSIPQHGRNLYTYILAVDLILAYRKDVNARPGQNQYHLYVHRIRFSVAETTMMLPQYSIYSGFCRKIFNLLMNIFIFLGKNFGAEKETLARVEFAGKVCDTRCNGHGD